MAEKVASLYAEISADTSKLQKGLGTVRSEMKTTTDAAGKLKGGLSSVSGLKFTELASVVDLAKQAFQAAKKVVEETVGEFTTYAKTVEDMARVTGSSAEEVSRLIQVSDDLQISTASLEQAMAGAVRKGIDPSVDSIASLADEYLALAPGLERSQFLVEKFGRSGLEMAKLMEQGGDKIRDMGAAVDDSLIITDEAIEANQRYMKAMDDLGDAVQGLKVRLGNSLIPVLTDAGNTAMLLLTWEEQLDAQYRSHASEIERTIPVWEDYARELVRSALAAGQLHGMEARKARALLDGEIAAEHQADALSDLVAELGGVRDGYKGNTEATWEWSDALHTMVPIAEKATLGAQALADASEESSVSMDKLKTVMAGAVGKEYRDYYNTMADITEETDDLKTKIGELEGKRWLTSEQKQELQDYKDRLSELGERATNASLEHRKAMASIVYDMQYTKAMADGTIDEIEYKTLSDFAGAMGLIDDATLDTYYALEKMNETIGGSKEKAELLDEAMGMLTLSLADGRLEAEELERILDYLNGKTFESDFRLKVSGFSGLQDVLKHGKNVPIPQAEGGDWIVRKPTLFLAGEAGAERATFTPLDGRGGGNTTRNMTVNFYGNYGSASEIAQRLAMMEAYGV